jgi:hypothetical protein
MPPSDSKHEWFPQGPPTIARQFTGGKAEKNYNRVP